MCDSRTSVSEAVTLPVRKHFAAWGRAKDRFAATFKSARVDEPRADTENPGRYPAGLRGVSADTAFAGGTDSCPEDGHMSKVRHSLVAVPLLLVVSVLAGCGTTPAKDFGGRWKPVNRFAQAPTEIPLYSSYVFQASPTDRTLKTMLERWARDTGLVLDYRLTSDYTLYGPVAGLNTTSAQQAVSKVTSAYATQGLSVSINGNAMTVSQAGQLPAPADETKNSPGS